MDVPEEISLIEGCVGGIFQGGFSSASSHNNNRQNSKPKIARTSNPRQRGAGVSPLIYIFVLSAAVTHLIIHSYDTTLMQPNLRKNDGVVPEENLLNESQQMNELQKDEENGGPNHIKITTSVTSPPAKEMRENDGSIVRALKGIDLKKIQVDKVIPKKDESASPPSAQEMRGNDGNSVKTLKSTDVKKIQLNGEDKGKSNSIKITTNSINLFPRGCHWECYIDNHPDLRKALPRTEEAANAHYVESSAKETRDCRC